MDEAIKIFDYLPLSYKTPIEAEYVNFLWESFEVNYNAEKYPFAFIAFNMLYMSFVYFEVWQIKQNRRRDFEMAMVGFNKDHEKNLVEATTPFSFSLIQERSFFRFLKLLNCQNDRIGNFGKIIDARNLSAHSNGNIYINSQQAIDDKINDVLRFVDEIQNLSEPIIDTCLIEFLKNSWNADERQYLDDAEQIREVLIHDNYLSQKDIEQMRGFDISQLSAEKHFAEMENLFNEFARLYKPDE
jgi:hypothetical protein